MTRRERREEEAEARAQRGGREGAERGETRSDGETMTESCRDRPKGKTELGERQRKETAAAGRRDSEADGWRG